MEQCLRPLLKRAQLSTCLYLTVYVLKLQLYRILYTVIQSTVWRRTIKGASLFIHTGTQILLAVLYDCIRIYFSQVVHASSLLVN